MTSVPTIRTIALAASILAFFCDVFAAGQESGRKPSVSCEQLGGIKLKDVSSITAQSITAGAFTPPAGMPIKDLPPFCRLSLVIKPQINIEVWLPMVWNERFQAVGGGGYAAPFPGRLLQLLCGADTRRLPRTPGTTQRLNLAAASR